MRLAVIPQVNPDIFGEALCARLKAHCESNEERFEKLVALVRYTAENYNSMATSEADGDASITPYLTAFDNALRRTEFTENQRTLFNTYVRTGSVKRASRAMGKRITHELSDCCEKIAVHYAKGDVGAWGR